MLSEFYLQLFKIDKFVLLQGEAVIREREDSKNLLSLKNSLDLLSSPLSILKNNGTLASAEVENFDIYGNILHSSSSGIVNNEGKGVTQQIIEAGNFASRVAVCLHKEALLLLAGSEPHTSALISLAFSLPSLRLSHWLSIAINGIARSNGGHHVLLKSQLNLTKKYAQLKDDQKRYLGILALRNLLSSHLDLNGVQLSIRSSKVRFLTSNHSHSHSILKKSLHHDHVYEGEDAIMNKDLGKDFLKGDGDTLSEEFSLLVTDIAVLFFGCGFGGSLKRALSLMVIGLAGLARFPCPDAGGQAMCLFPDKSSWNSVKKARNWLHDIRDAIHESIQKDTNESFGGIQTVSLVIFQALQPSTIAKSSSSISMSDKPLSIFAWSSTILLPKVPSPSSSSSSSFSSPLSRFFDQEWVQERASPIPIYVSGLISAAYFFRTLGKSLVSSFSSSFSSSSSRINNASLWTIDTLTSEKSTLDIGSSLKSLDTVYVGFLMRLFSCQILYFLSTLPSNEAAGTRSRLRPLCWRLLLETLNEAGAYSLVITLSMTAKQDLSLITKNEHCAFDPHSFASLEKLATEASTAVKKQRNGLAKKITKKSVQESETTDDEDDENDDDEDESDAQKILALNEYPITSTGSAIVSGIDNDSHLVHTHETTSKVMIPTIAVQAKVWGQAVSTIALSPQSNFHTAATIGGGPGGGPLGLSTLNVSGLPKPLPLSTSSESSTSLVSRKRRLDSPTSFPPLSSSSSSSEFSSFTSSTFSPIISILPGRNRIYYICVDEAISTIIPGTVERVAADAISRSCGSTYKLLEDSRSSEYFVDGQRISFSGAEERLLVSINYTYKEKGDQQNWRETNEDMKKKWIEASEREAKGHLEYFKLTSTQQCSNCFERLASLICKGDPKLCGMCCGCRSHVTSTHYGAFFEHFTGKPRPVTMAPSGYDLRQIQAHLMKKQAKKKEADARAQVAVPVFIMPSKTRIPEVSEISRKAHLIRKTVSDTRPPVVESCIYGTPFDLLDDLTCFQLKKRRKIERFSSDQSNDSDMNEDLLESDEISGLPMSTVHSLLSSRAFVKDAGLSFTTPMNRSVKVTYGENALWSTFYGLLCSPIDLACASEQDAVAIRHPWVTSHPSGGFLMKDPTTLHHIEELKKISGCDVEQDLSHTISSLKGVLLPRLRHDLFPKTSLTGIAHAGGGEALSVVLNKLSRHYVSNFSGLPDVAVWDDPQTCPFCSEEHRLLHAQLAKSSTSSHATVEESKVVPRLALVEVKSSSDSLAKHQLDWLEYLNGCKGIKTRKTPLPGCVLHVVSGQGQ